MPYEVSVRVKLDDESGAAGLCFASDGNAKHYGLYPSGGQIRLTHFAGPDVFSWNILSDNPVDVYRPGEWNHLRAVVDESSITGFVNGKEIVRLEHNALRGGKVGLCKFRQTEASFQQFTLSSPNKDLDYPAQQHLAEVGAALDDWLASRPDAAKSIIESHPQPALQLLSNRAQELEQRAAELRQWAVRLHERQVCHEMAALIAEENPQDIDLFHAGLLISKLANPELDVAAYRQELEAMAEEIRDTLEDGATETAILDTLSDYLFRQLGFHGSRLDYYSRENSYLNAVLEDREGIPITLSVLYLELAQRLGVKDIVGIPLPGHFVVQHRPEKNDPESFQLIDVFDAGKKLTEDDARDLVENATGLTLAEGDLEAASKPAILVRMLRNLISIDLNSNDSGQALPELDLLLTISPEEASERLSRALLRYQGNRLPEALEDLDWIREHRPPGVHLDRIEELRNRIRATLER